MNILILTIPITLTLVILFVLFFVLSVKSGQFDDLDTPAHAPILDENPNTESETLTAGESNHVR